MREKTVYKDEDFIIKRFKGKTTTYIYEVIPITKKGIRLSDIQICPDYSTLKKAKSLMERNRSRIQKYKKSKLI